MSYDYEERKEIKKQVSQLLADNGLNRGTIKEIILEEIRNKVNGVVDDTIKSLDAQCSSGNWMKEQALRYFKDQYLNSYACNQTVKEALSNRIINITLKNVVARPYEDTLDTKDVLDYLEKNADEYPDYHQAIEDILKMAKSKENEG